MEKFKTIQNNHLALTQYYRWYQVYEVPLNKARVDNQLDILADDVEISSQAGTSKGKLGIADRLKMFEGWQNAHHVENTSVKQLNDEELSLEADILYQNIRPDDSRYSYKIHYSTTLRLRENDLPLFTKVHLEPTGTIDNPQFQSAYAENRAKSFMHYWLYLMETASVNGDKFQELLADQFELNLSTTSKITCLEGFNEWLATIPNQVKQSGHYPKNLSVTENADHTITVSVDFEWEGISAQNKPMVAETHHEWILENNLNERFARMKMMKVTQTKPFQTVE
ncbi:hypothetical protein [Paenibacillus chitinolyticus]|uniref:hypothetical protein n=1 Tax=Paenibacillus chitinolyticus TaxID=79263 RepID=UPI0036557E19